MTGPRYVARAHRPRADEHSDWIEFATPRTVTVYEPETRAEATGLLDQHGVPLYRVPDRVRCGFHAHAGDDAP